MEVYHNVESGNWGGQNKCKVESGNRGVKKCGK